MISDCETYACVSFPWLYKTIAKRTRKAERNARVKFLNARRIQRLYEKYLARKNAEIRDKAATVIQKWWRGYMARERYYYIVEEAVNKACHDWYYWAAVTIQKWWRGFITRLKVHDHRKLRAAQLEAARELILCIAYKLHHLLRTNQIPGIYSLKNTNILSRVEQLLASLRFKEYNDTMRRIRAEKAKRLAEAKEESMKSAIKTKVPYSPACKKFFRENKIEKIYSLLDTVDALRKVRAPKVKPPQTAGLQPKDACDDVVRSMKRWEIVNDEKNLSVSPHIVRKPENIENFLGEIEAICYQEKLVNDQDACCV